ncbi:MAG: hypothetical protein IPL41_12440 [Micropruina sp.]|nr:hypothetical protein [Micropruina sp.]
MSRLRSVAALVACLAMVAVLSGLRSDGVAKPRSYTAGVDGWAHAPTASGRVAGARLARSVVRPSIEEPLVTEHVFVVIELEVQVRDRVLPLSRLTMETSDGHSYAQLSDAGLGGLTLTQPGFTVHGNAVFELPPERVPGATLIVSTQSDMLVIYRAQLAFHDVVRDDRVLDEVRLVSAHSEVTR